MTGTGSGVLDEILPRVRETGAHFQKRLSKLVDKYDFVSEVRGSGLMCGLNLTAPSKSVSRPWPKWVS